MRFRPKVGMSRNASVLVSFLQRGGSTSACIIATLGLFLLSTSSSTIVLAENMDVASQNINQCTSHCQRHHSKTSDWISACTKTCYELEQLQATSSSYSISSIVHNVNEMARTANYHSCLNHCKRHHGNKKTIGHDHTDGFVECQHGCENELL